MQLQQQGSLRIYRFHNLSGTPGIMHFISTRHGGVSEGNYESLNLGFRTMDSPENVIENRRRLSVASGIDLQQFVFANQVHGNNVSLISAGDSSAGVFSIDNDIRETDAMISAEKGLCLTVMVADCVPVLLYDKKNQLVAAIHAGWQGTVKKIVEITVHKMISEFQSDPVNILAGIGPSIGPCCYEVGDNVCEAVLASFPASSHSELLIPKNSKFHFNLWEANKLQMMSAGIPESNIEISNMCSLCRHDEFFSYRHFKSNSGRFAAGIMMT